MDKLRQPTKIMDDTIKDAVLSPELEETDKNVVIVDAVKHYDDMNKVVVEGPVVSVFETKNNILFTVLTNTGRNGQETSGVSITANKDIAQNVVKGSHVHVEGKLYARLLHDTGTYEMAVSAVKIEPCKSNMEEEFGLSGRTYGLPFNRITLVGNIARMSQVNKNTATVLLLVKEKNERQRFVEVTIFANNLRKLLPQLAIGNRVIMSCEYRVRKREGREGEKPQYFRNIVSLDFKNV